MYAVIFRAQVKALDDAYLNAAKRMRGLAFEKYGCLDFVSLCENGEELAISYWPSLDAIQRWRNDEEHKSAQRIGAERWYSSYRVEVVELVRSYNSVSSFQKQS